MLKYRLTYIRWKPQAWRGPVSFLINMTGMRGCLFVSVLDFYKLGGELYVGDFLTLKHESYLDG